MWRRDTWSWTESVSVDFPGLSPELRAGRMCLSLGSVLKCPHMETSWTELKWAFPKCHLSLWVTPGPVLIMGTLTHQPSAGFGEQAGEMEEWPRWMFPVWAPAFSPCCFSWRFIYLLLQLGMNRDAASIHAASPVLVTFSEGFWKSCWPSTASTERECLHWSRLILVCSKLSPGLPAGREQACSVPKCWPGHLARKRKKS